MRGFHFTTVGKIVRRSLSARAVKNADAPEGRN
jgi:hypothetical protein